MLYSCTIWYKCLSTSLVCVLFFFIFFASRSAFQTPLKEAASPHSSPSLVNYAWWHLSPRDQSVCLIQSLTPDPLRAHPPSCAPTSPRSSRGDVSLSEAQRIPFRWEMSSYWHEAACGNKEDESRAAGHLVASDTNREPPHYSAGCRLALWGAAAAASTHMTVYSSCLLNHSFHHNLQTLGELN